MEIMPSMHNTETTVAFVHVKQFAGEVTKISLEYAKALTRILTELGKTGFDSIEIGVEDKMPLLVFLAKDRETAFCITSRVDAEED